MDIDRILQIFSERDVKFLLLGGVNFLLRHEPVLTYDVDLWIEPSEDNRVACEKALVALNASWGKTDEDWRPVAEMSAGWLNHQQAVYCLASPSGAIDIFLEVKGLQDWNESASKSIEIGSASGVTCRGLCDDDMLTCQLALTPEDRKQSRVDYYRQQNKKP